MRFLWRCSLLLLITAAGLLAGDEIERVQRELRARKLYFGPLDGRMSSDTGTALRRFQRAKGLEAHGEANLATLRALGISAGEKEDAVAREMARCCDVVARYLQARERGEWSAEEAFYEKSVRYFGEGPTDREKIRELHEREYRRWPQRRYVLLNRLASPISEGGNEALVTARIRTDVSKSAGARESRTEDVCFRLRRIGSEWRIGAMQVLDAAPQ